VGAFNEGKPQQDMTSRAELRVGCITFCCVFSLSFVLLSVLLWSAAIPFHVL